MDVRRYVAILIAMVVILSVAHYAEARGGGGHSSSGGNKSVYVHGYFRKDGTYVSPYYRSSPSSSVGYIPTPYPYAPPDNAAPSPGQMAPVQPNPAITPPLAAPTAPTAPTAPVAVLPPPSSKIAECQGKGWCYVTFTLEGTQEARSKPMTDISYPPAPGVSMPRMIIYNQQ